jgi:midasin
MASTSRLPPILGGLSNFDLQKQVVGFLAAYPKFSAPPALIFHETARTTDVLDALATMLAIPAFTARVSTDFRPLLMDLCARWLKLNDLDDARVFEAFASLIGVHEEIYP